MTWWQLGHSLEGGISHGCFTVPIAGEKRPVRAKQPRQQDIFFGPPAAPVQGKGLGPDQRGGVLDSCGRIVLITYEGRRPGQLHPKDCHSKYSRAKWH